MGDHLLRSVRRREFAIAASLLAATAGGVWFIVAYVVSAGRLQQGLALALAAAGFAFAATGWAFWVLQPRETVDVRDDVPSPGSDRALEDSEFEGGEAQLARSGLLNRMLYAALGVFAAALVVPLRSLGHGPGSTLFHTKWRSGARVVREDGTPVRIEDLNVDSIVTVFPESAPEDPQSQAVLIRLPESSPAGIFGYIAFSKICTHAGCPVALYRASEHQLMCPCHQSVFDVLSNGSVVSGPADHALPRLPLEIGADGFVRAAGDFPEPVGPGFWERS